MAELSYNSQPWQQTDSIPPERAENSDKYLDGEQLKWLDRTLGDLPALLDDLEVAVTKQVRFAPAPTPAGDGSESPVPFSDPASGARHRVEYAVCGVAGLLWHSLTGQAAPFRSVRAAGLWLQSNLGKMALDPNGEEMLHRIGDAVRRAYQIIDRPPSWQYLGRCPTCRADLHAQRGENTVTCNHCGWSAPVGQVVQEALDNAEDQLLTDGELVGAVSLGGEETVTRRQIQYWREKGRLEVHVSARWRDTTGRLEQVQVSRLGDVIELAKEKSEKGAVTC